MITLALHNTTILIITPTSSISSDTGAQAQHSVIIEGIGGAMQGSIDGGEEACETGYSQSGLSTLSFVPDGIFKKWDAFFDAFRKESKANGKSKSVRIWQRPKNDPLSEEHILNDF